MSPKKTAQKATSSHIFGPVSSRRLGRSLGLDLLSYKTCSLDCVYCECGATTSLTLERRIFVPTATIIAELSAILTTAPALDYITFSGSGEPTLAWNIGEVIAYLKKEWPAYKVAVLTNSTLLSDPEVRQALAPCDLLVPSLDAASPAVFQAINLPSANLDVATIIDGLQALRHEYHGRLWLEVFILPGINDHPAEITRLSNIVRDLSPDRVQLNSLDRPGAVSGLHAASPASLSTIAASFAPLPVDIVTRGPATSPPRQSHVGHSTAVRILETIKRRPSTFSDLESALLIPPGELQDILATLSHSGHITAHSQGTTTFYRFSP